jgi:hypothetical protein
MMYVGMPRLYPILSALCGVLGSVRLALTALLVLSVAAPASAQPVLDPPLHACYVSDGVTPDRRETMHVRATGFTPAAFVDLKIDGQLVYGDLRADVDGTITANPPAPFQGRGERPFTVALEEQDNAANIVTGSSLVTNLSVTLRPKRANPARTVRFSGRGFTNVAPIYGHYVFGGKVRKTIRLARRPVGACGVFHARRRQIPVRKPAIGEWILQVDQQRKYSTHPDSNAQPVIIRVAQVVKQP